MADTHALKAEALAAVEKSRWKKALECYEALGRAEPADGMWPQKAGDMHRKLGNLREAVAAYGVAMDRFSKGSVALKAIAVCKLILEIDPKHPTAMAKIAASLGMPAPPAAAKTLPTMQAVPDYVPKAEPKVEQKIEPAIDAAQGAPPSTDRPSLLDMMADMNFDDIIPPIPTAPAPAPRPGQHELASETLPKTPLFSALTPGDLAKLIERIRILTLEANQILFSAGDPGTAFYVVASGEISVRTTTEVARLQEGAFLGEIAVLIDQPRGATAVATKPTQLLEIDRTTLNTLAAESPELTKVFLSFVRDRLTANLFETSPLFGNLTPSDRILVAARFRFATATAGLRAIEQGKKSAGLFVLLAGKASVIRDGKIVATLGPGEAFGEISLLADVPATAMVQISTKSFLLMLPRADFSAVLDAIPSLRASLSAIAEGRLPSGHWLSCAIL